VPVKAGQEEQSPSKNAWPAGHVQRPPEQTPPPEAPQAAPILFGSAPPLTHCCDPVAQEWMPTAQGSTDAEEQESPATQGTHCPPLHTILGLELHGVPLACVIELGTHVVLLTAQLIVPSWQEFPPTVQLALGVHEEHVPL
jgi:hypothetical protein